MKNYFFIFCFLLIVMGCDTAKTNSDFIIDKTIEEEVNSKISESELGTSFDNLFLVYDNILIADFYESDSISFSTKNSEKKMPFKSFFYKRNDTISIDGAYGLFGGFGFSLKIIDNKPTLYHMLAGDDFPMYAMTEDGDLKFRIEVPCSDAKIILSKIPEAKDKEIIYGVVEFKSDPFYEAISINKDGDSNGRKKNQVAMKIYFKSRYYDFDQF